MDQRQRAAVFVAGVSAGVAVTLAVPRLFSLACKLYCRRRGAGGGGWRAVADDAEERRMEGASPAYMDALEQSFRVPTAKLHALVKHFILELNKGLAAPGQTIGALPSYVTRLPTGKETGSYLALDLGGTNLRVCEIVLEGHGKMRLRQKKHTISEELKVSTADRLFDFVAAAIDEFLVEMDIKSGRVGQDRLLLGFTFSYPIDQTGINSGTLIQWNKGFTVEEVVGCDVVSLLRAAMERKGLNIDVVAIVNDTVGTLVSHAYVDTETNIGVILGTGTNAAYVERVSSIPKWKTHYGNKPVDTDQMVINIEWGAFDNEKVILPVTRYDNALDRASENPGKQIFEKMISGMYLGEIARLAIVDLVHDGFLFRGKLSAPMAERFRFETQFMSRIERDHSQDLGDTKALLEDMFEVYGTALQDRQTVKRICELVGIRAARLSAGAIAGVVSKMNKLNGCTVAIDGSVFEHYPHFRSRMYDALREVFGLSTDNLHLELARDGSGVGAALIAATMGISP